MKAEAYLMYVRPILEYANCSWAPHTQFNIEKLEAVHKGAQQDLLLEIFAPPAW